MDLLATHTLGPGTEDELGLQAGPYAFFFFVALAVALFFLVRSMRKQMRRVDFNEAGLTDAERMSRSEPAEPSAEDDSAK